MCSGGIKFLFWLLFLFHWLPAAPNIRCGLPPSCLWVSLRGSFHLTSPWFCISSQARQIFRVSYIVVIQQKESFGPQVSEVAIWFLFVWDPESFSLRGKPSPGGFRKRKAAETSSWWAGATFLACIPSGIPSICALLPYFKKIQAPHFTNIFLWNDPITTQSHSSVSLITFLALNSALAEINITNLASFD